MRSKAERVKRPGNGVERGVWPWGLGHGGNGYLRTVCDYVHLNPVRAHLLGTDERLLAYPWSSFGWYLAAPEHRPGWVRVDRLWGEHGIQQDSPAGRQEFERHMEARRLEEADEEEIKALRRGWCLGSEPFRQKMLELMEGKLGENHSGELHRETAEQKANRIICEELSRLGWQSIGAPLAKSRCSTFATTGVSFLHEYAA